MDGLCLCWPLPPKSDRRRVETAVDLLRAQDAAVDHLEHVSRRESCYSNRNYNNCNSFAIHNEIYEHHHKLDLVPRRQAHLQQTLKTDTVQNVRKSQYAENMSDQRRG